MYSLNGVSDILFDYKWPATVGMLFSRMDKKRDGIVRVSEVSNTAKELCPNTTKSQLDMLERLVDTNKSGESYVQIFLMYMCVIHII